MKTGEYFAELEKALDEYRFQDIRILTDRIDPSGFSLPEMKKALGMMRRKRCFSDLEHTAGLFALSGHAEPVIRRQWAQAVLDQNRVAQGLRSLEDMASKAENDPLEGPEIRGLIGRAYKQLYVNEGGPDNLRSAIAFYAKDWQLETSPLGKTLLPVIEYALLQKEGGSVEPLNLSGEPQKAGFEAVWGDKAYVYMQWIDTLYSCCNAIARIIDTGAGAAKGTGFLVQGAKLRAEWGDAPVLMTNSHVISRNPADEAPLRPEDATAEFTRLPGRPKVVFSDLLFSSPRVELDVSVLKIDPPGEARMLEPYP
jgi:hypothetical protein